MVLSEVVDFMDLGIIIEITVAIDPSCDGWFLCVFWRLVLSTSTSKHYNAVKSLDESVMFLAN